MLHDSPPPRYDLSKLTVLLVDDSTYMTRLMGAVLRGLKVGRVAVATNSGEGWLRFVEVRPDIIISDWRMRPLSGPEFLNKVRHDPASPNRYVPFIFLTGFTEKKKIEMARDSGTHDFLAKPVTAKLIYERIVHLIENPRPFIESESFFGPDRRRRRRELPAGTSDRRGRGKRPAIEQKDDAT
jgi:response regulator RpfG family c-di-GMP phosphodiesterase